MLQWSSFALPLRELALLLILLGGVTQCHRTFAHILNIHMSMLAFEYLSSKRAAVCDSFAFVIPVSQVDALSVQLTQLDSFILNIFPFRDLQVNALPRRRTQRFTAINSYFIFTFCIKVKLKYYMVNILH